MKKAFSLVEVLMVLAVLGILAAIAIPTFQGYITEAKESAAKDNLRILRTAIESYAAHHGDVAPGNSSDQAQANEWFVTQLLTATKEDGASNGTKTASDTHPFGPYISSIPVSPFNDEKTLKILGENGEFANAVTGNFGWLYKPSAKAIRLDWLGKDRDDVPYIDY